jgi:YD repeat-containing protein
MRAEPPESLAVNTSPDPIGSITTYTYSVYDRNRCIEVARPGGRVTRIEYDDACHMIRETDPDGRVSERVDAPVPIRCTTYTYDIKWRLIAVTGPD